MKRLLERFNTLMAEAALLEEGAAAAAAATRTRPDRETLEENLIEVAFAEAAEAERRTSRQGSCMASQCRTQGSS